MNRRIFCLSGVAAAICGAAGGSAGLPAAEHAAQPAPADSEPRVKLYKFIYDRRFSAGRAFGAAAEYVRSTAGTKPVGGDITALWSLDLRPQWSAGGGAIAGMTTARTLFCLEQLAKDHWMRVVVRAEHAISRGHDAAHRVTAPEPMMPRMNSALASEYWPAKMPAALTMWEDAVRAPQMTRVVGTPWGHRFGGADEALVSFIIA